MGSSIGPSDLNGMAMWVYQQSTGKFSSADASGTPNGVATVTNIQVGLRIGTTGSTINAQVQGKTYCFGSKEAMADFMKDPTGNLAKAQAYYSKKHPG